MIQYFVYEPTGEIREIQIGSRIDNIRLKKQNLRPATLQERIGYLNSLEERRRRIHEEVKTGKLHHVHYLGSQYSPDGYGNTGRYFARNSLEHKVFLDYEFEGQDIGLCYFPPPGIAELKTRVKVLYTMFESTRYPQEWIEHLEAADHIVTPSPWCAEVIRAHVDRPVTIIPLGYDERIFRPLKRERNPDDPYTFLHYDAFKARKGWDIVFQAFTEEFTDDDNVRLVFKALAINPIPPLHMYPRIEVIQKTFDLPEFEALLARCDSFVFPSLGEGFGIPPLEAMRSGMHVICSDHTGMDFAPRTIDEYRIVPAKYDKVGLRGCSERQDLGFQFRPTVAAVRRAMRHAYENRLHGHYPEIEHLTMANSVRQLSEFIRSL